MSFSTFTVNGPVFETTNGMAKGSVALSGNGCETETSGRSESQAAANPNIVNANTARSTAGGRLSGASCRNFLRRPFSGGDEKTTVSTMRVEVRFPLLDGCVRMNSNVVLAIRQI